MKKLTFYDMVDLLEKFNNSYYDFYDRKIKINNKTYSGEVFVLDNELTKEQKAIFEVFPNVIVGRRTILQAPEINTNCIFLSDTRFERKE